MEKAVVDTDVMHIATIEGKIGRTEILFPFAEVDCLAILVVIADNREKAHLGRTQCLTYLTLQLGIVAAIILHIIAHAQSIYGSSCRKTLDGLPDICHRLGCESFYIAFLDRIIIRRSIVRAVGIGNLRVADDYHLIMRLLAARQSAQRKIIDFLLLGYSLVEISRAVGCRMGRYLAIGRHGIIDEASQTVSLHLISSVGIGLYAVESIAHDDSSHSPSLGIFQGT